MKCRNIIDVMFENSKVGTLAETGEKNTFAFQYSREWLLNGFSISPLKIDFNDTVQTAQFNNDYHDIRVFGVFKESLPDAWGNRILDLRLSEAGIDPKKVGFLDRLTIMQENNRGALYYLPQYDLPLSTAEEVINFSREYSDIDFLAKEIGDIVNGKTIKYIDLIYSLGSGSGGTRPKVNYKINSEDWIIKFPGPGDPADIGVQEYDYCVCAKKCGVNVPEVKLLKSNNPHNSHGYFAIKRFDRAGNRKIHMVSAAGLLDKFYYCDPAFDYQTLFAMSMQLTNNFEHNIELYKLMCFNVFAHNIDDHSKNFSFLYNTQQNNWELAPAYDLTCSTNVFNTHATYVNGSVNPSIDDIASLAEYVGMRKTTALSIAKDIKNVVEKDLGKYIRKAKICEGNERSITPRLKAGACKSPY